MCRPYTPRPTPVPKSKMNEKILPSPGDVVTRDFRPRVRRRPEKNQLRIVQWNIERGYELEGIISELKNLDPDIIGLQEVDIHCKRSGNVDIGEKIAQELGMHYAFVCEFTEINSPARSGRDEGGGVHGNAILTHYDFITVETIRHQHHPVDWESRHHRKARAEPRKGERLVLCAVVDLPATPPIVVYSCHLEVFCGISDRLYQFSDVLKDSRRKEKAGYKRQVILGDLNTLADGLVRLAPLICTDHLRFKTIGKREATFWKENLFQVTDGSEEHLIEEGGKLFNAKLLGWGLDKEYCKQLINPGFEDPWDTDSDVTLQRPRSGSWTMKFVSGKLDWLLVRQMTILHKSIGNEDYSYSDHKWLLVTVSDPQDSIIC